MDVHEFPNDGIGDGGVEDAHELHGGVGGCPGVDNDAGGFVHGCGAGEDGHGRTVVRGVVTCDGAVQIGGALAGGGVDGGGAAALLVGVDHVVEDQESGVEQVEGRADGDVWCGFDAGGAVRTHVDQQGAHMLAAGGDVLGEGAGPGGVPVDLINVVDELFESPLEERNGRVPAEQQR